MILDENPSVWLREGTIFYVHDKYMTDARRLKAMHYSQSLKLNTPS